MPQINSVPSSRLVVDDPSQLRVPLDAARAPATLMLLLVFIIVLFGPLITVYHE